MSPDPNKPCPHCGRPADREGNPHHPFCSERCKLIDLGNWAAERYRIPDRPAGGPELESGMAEREQAEDRPKGKAFR